MFQAIDNIPAHELYTRHEHFRELLHQYAPEAGGMLIFGLYNIYYTTGSMVAGLVWLPRKGDPILAVRKGVERARLESPLKNIVSYRSYTELPGLFADLGSPLSTVIAVDQGNLSWSQGMLLASRLQGHTFVSGTPVIDQGKAIKSPWELERLRQAGRRHCKAFCEYIPTRIKPGITEFDIANIMWNAFFELEHCGPTPAGMSGVGTIFGNVCVGNNGNYPTSYDGPLGLKGIHPSSPFLGCRDTIWKEGDLLTLDAAFNYQGYMTDKTQVYFAGKEQDIPDVARKAQEVTETIEKHTAAMLRPGIHPAHIYQESLRIADEAGFSSGFMGLGGNQVKFLGHSIGLNVSEWPILARGFTEPLQENMVIALEPKIGIPGLAMVGVENTFIVTPDGGECLSGITNGITCIE